MMRKPIQAGFTLIELLVTVTIVAVLASVALPAFTGLAAKRRLEGAANELSTDLQYARTQAAANNADMLFKISSSTQYDVCLSDRAVTPNCVSGTASYKTVTFDTASGLTLSPSTLVVVFTPLRTSASTAATVDIGNSSGGALRATVTLLGRVTLCLPSGSNISGYPSC